MGTNEQGYLDLVRLVIATGEIRADRTGVGTRALFAKRLSFDLRNGAFPLLTTKRIAFKNVAEELFWFLRGSTDVRELQARGVHIWDANAAGGVLGPIYGQQWRHFGSDELGAGGVDQIAEVVRRIQTEPTSRRIFFSARNPTQLAQMALPPCHVSCQFFVSHPGTPLAGLSAHVYQRSADLGLGVPYNVASYALLVVAVASLCRLRPIELVLSFGYVHVYENHVEPLLLQLERTHRPFPTICAKRPLDSLDHLALDDFELLNYNPHQPISMNMAR